jgi:tripartite-type tricarboxylate transporter receptor subunit TctC
VNTSRRRFLQALGIAGTTASFLKPAFAADYPNRPVRIVVGYPAGSPSDIGARMMAQWLSTKLGQPFVIDNQPGAASNIATENVIRSSADGYTLLWVVSAHAINATLYKKLNYNYLRDIQSVCGLARFPQIMEVAPEFPAKTVAEFIAYAKANPGKVNMASSGNGSAQHIAGELFKAMAGVDLVHVPYRGAPQAITDLIGGQVQVMFDVWPSSIGQVKSGKLRALGVTTEMRSPLLPDVPTIADTVKGYEASALQGLGAPKGTPADIVALLNKEMNAALADKEFSAKLIELGGLPLTGTPAAFTEVMTRETEKVGKIITQAGITVE